MQLRRFSFLPLFSCLLTLTTFAMTIAVTDGIAEDSAYHATEIQIQGNKRIDIDAIKAQIKSVPGTVTVEQASQDVATLYKTGFFKTVDAAVVDGSSGPVLVFKVVEKPMVRKVFTKGNDQIGESDLVEIIKFGEKRFFDKNKIDSLKRAVVSFYQTKGYNDAAITDTEAEVGDNQVDVTFNITEGRRYKLRRIEFKGLKKIDVSDLRDVMQTKTYKWYSSWLFGTGRASEDVLESDRSAIRQYFLDHGFVEGTISDAHIESNSDKAEVTVSFDVSEGKEFKVGTITASGDLIENSVAKTIDGIESESGETFSAAKIRKDSFTISDKFGDKAFAFANVTANTDIQSERGIVNLNFQTSKGKPVKINRINIKGNEKTYDNVIRRELKVQEQEPYNSSKVKRSQVMLERLGYFDEVSVSNEPIVGHDDLVDLNVTVKEAPSTGSFSIGAGYSTSDGAIANARLTENNILGTGRRIDLNADIGTQRTNLNLALSDRRIWDTDLSGSIEGFRSTRDFNDFQRVLTGGAVSVGYPLESWFGETFEDFNSSLRLEGGNADIRSVKDTAATLIKNSEGTMSYMSLTPSISRNTINNPLNPRKGSNQVISFEYGGLAGDAEYTLLEAKNTVYYPIGQTAIGEFVFSNRTRLAYGESQNNDPFPLFKRYFPGGINSVRGYDSRSLGPKENGSEYGGSKQFINNTELIFPLIESAGIRGVLFYDIGQSYDDNQSLDLSLVRQSWGTGIRWMSPLGPLRFELGFPINREPGENSMQPMFSFGAPM